MTAHPALAGRHPHRAGWPATAPIRQSMWLAGGFMLAFLIPFVFADWLEINRDVYYGIYGAAVISFVAAWAWSTDRPLARLASRRPWLTLALALASSTVLVLIVYRTDDATPHPKGLEFAAAIAWRGVFYGAVDGLLLSVFPILAVFAAFEGRRLSGRGGTFVVALIALAASLAMTAVYHAGYSDFRGEKIRKPLVGDVVWSAPTLLTLNPIGAPLAHVSLHTAAVVHSYETETFLPPHAVAADERR
jgi:cobalamin synthase